MPISPPQSEVTRLVAACADGEESALDRLFSLVYDDLRAIAHRKLRSERPDHTLSTTALVHEAYLQLVDQTRSDWRGRAHFFALASRVMRHVLIDHARRSRAEKRGGDRVRVPLHPGLAVSGDEDGAVDLLALDEALSALSGRDERMGKVVECRFFGGMTVQETAEALGLSARTVERDWTRAKAYLYRELAGS